MGNVLSGPPVHYSKEYGHERDTEGRYLQTYQQRPISSNDPDDQVSVGKAKFQMGVKVLQDVQNGQMYVTSPAGQKVYLSHGNPPQFLPNASSLISQGANYGRGPAAFITGSPLAPRVTLFASSDMTASRQYQPIRINNRQDLKYALETGHMGQDLSAKYAGSYGQSAINPFLKRGDDFESGVADAGRFLVDKTLGLWAGVPGMIMDAIQPGLGLVQGALQQAGLDPFKNAADALAKEITTPDVTEANYQSGSYDPNMANVITDPRLESFFQQLQTENQNIPGANNFTYMGQENAQQMINKGRMMAQENQRVSVNDQINNLASNMLAVQSKFPNAKNIGLEQYEQGLKLATNNQQKLNVVNHFKKQLSTEYLPLVKNDPSLVQSLRKPVLFPLGLTPIQDQLHGLPEGLTTINGDYHHRPDETTVEG